MKHVAILLLLLSTCICGCSSRAYFAETIEKADLGLYIKRVRADGIWRSSETGHGLQIYVWAESEADRYERNLDLELNGAAQVCAALASSDRIQKWAYIDVYYFNTYLQMLKPPRKIVGVAEVIVRQEILSMLRNQHVPASEYPKHWRFIAGHKDQPDSKVLLSW